MASESSDPPPPGEAVAALAAQLEELRGRLLRAEGGVGQVRARLDEFAGTDMVMLKAIKDLGEKLDEAVARLQIADPPAPYWLGLSREDHAAQLAELQDWVNQVGLVQYPGYFAKLPPCWASHAEALIELSTVATEWERIYADPDNRPLPDALVWHDKWLPDALRRLAAAIKCDVSGCRLVQSSPWERSPPRYS
jgi:hypothetical protein